MFPAVQAALGLGLAAAKGMVDKAPVTIASGIDIKNYSEGSYDIYDKQNPGSPLVKVPYRKI